MLLSDMLWNQDKTYMPTTLAAVILQTWAECRDQV